MVLFFPIQQELDCICESGQILGKIKFDGAKNEYQFCADSDAVVLSDEQQAKIVARLTGLAAGQYTMAMQDDD